MNGIIAGAYKGVWKTPINDYDMPIILSSNKSLLANVSLTAEVSPSTNASAFFYLNFRDDYVLANGSFMKESSYLSRKFIIQFWIS